MLTWEDASEPWNEAFLRGLFTTLLEHHTLTLSQIVLCKSHMMASKTAVASKWMCTYKHPHLTIHTETLNLDKCKHAHTHTHTHTHIHTYACTHTYKAHTHTQSTHKHKAHTHTQAMYVSKHTCTYLFRKRPAGGLTVATQEQRLVFLGRELFLHQVGP